MINILIKLAQNTCYISILSHETTEEPSHIPYYNFYCSKIRSPNTISTFLDYDQSSASTCNHNSSLCCSISVKIRMFRHTRGLKIGSVLQTVTSFMPANPKLFTGHWLIQWISKPPESFEIQSKTVISNWSFIYNKWLLSIWNVRTTCKYFP